MPDKHKVIFYDTEKSDRALLEQQLRDHSQLDVTFVEQPLNEQTVTFAEDAQIISVFISSQISEDLLNAMPQLKLIAARSTGVNHINLGATTKRSVLVANVPTYGEHTVAEYTFALLLALARKLPAVIDKTKAGDIEHGQLRGFELAAKTLGIVGTGHIGKQVATIAKGFGMHVIGYDPFPDERAAAAIGYHYKSLEELLNDADIITLHAPYNEHNHHLLNAQNLAKIKPGAYLINTARGELVETAALIEALQSQRLGGAALDVIEGEQLLDFEEEIELLRSSRPSTQLELAMEHEVLLKMNNVIITNHNAFNTSEAIAKINAVTIDNIINFLAGSASNVVKGSGA